METDGHYANRRTHGRQMPRDPHSLPHGPTRLLAQRTTLRRPVGVADEENDIYVFSTTGQKIKWMGSNPRVCVQVDEIRSQSDWSGVIYREFQELPEPQFEHERAHARRPRKNAIIGG